MHWFAKFMLVFLAMAVLFLIMEIVRRRAGLQTAYTRKVIHIAMGVVILSSPLMFHAKYPALLMALALFLIDLLAMAALRRLMIKDYRTYGILYYPLVVFALILLCWDKDIHVLMGAVCLMSFGDGFSAIAGMFLGKHKFSISGDEKTLEGSAAMYVTSAVALFGAFFFYTKHPALSFAAAILIPVIATVIEAASSKGLDNLTVPVTGAILTYYLFSQGGLSWLWLAASVLTAAIVALAAARLGTLTASGAVAAFIIGSLIFAIGKLNAAFALITFFVTSSLLSRMGSGMKRDARTLTEKGSRRDMAQVLANGGVPLLLIVASMFNQCWWIRMYFLAALASVTADTWATEIGTLSRGEPLSLRTLARVPGGTSGAVSALGTFAAILGSCLMGLLAGFHMRGGFDAFSFAAVSIAGFAGCACDSVLGATVQAQYAIGGGAREMGEVRRPGSELVRGYAWMKNDLVNFVSSAFAAIICFLIFITLAGPFCR